MPYRWRRQIIRFPSITKPIIHCVLRRPIGQSILSCLFERNVPASIFPAHKRILPTSVWVTNLRPRSAFTTTAIDVGEGNDSCLYTCRTTYAFHQSHRNRILYRCAHSIRDTTLNQNPCEIISLGICANINLPIIRKRHRRSSILPA